MSDYAELVFDLRMMDRYTTHKAADAIEAQAARIAELEAALTAIDERAIPHASDVPEDWGRDLRHIRSMVRAALEDKG